MFVLLRSTKSVIFRIVGTFGLTQLLRIFTNVSASLALPFTFFIPCSLEDRLKSCFDLFPRSLGRLRIIVALGGLRGSLNVICCLELVVFFELLAELLHELLLHVLLACFFIQEKLTKDNVIRVALKFSVFIKPFERWQLLNHS